MMRLALTCWLLLAALLAVPAWAQADLPPRPEGPVYDGANMLSEQTEAALDQRLRAYNSETGRAIVVATVPTLGGETIEPYATRLFETWGIGGEQRDTGLLLLVARDERRMRIEVGYGLHPYFGGIMAGRVINDVITPRFKEGDFDAGVTQGVAAILDHLANSPQDAIAIEEAQQAAQEARQSRDGGFPIGAVIWIAFILFFFVLPMLRGRGRKRRFAGGRRGRSGPWGNVARDIILWEAGKAVVRGLSDGDDWGGGGGFGGGG
ncbi:MAG: TPM domain-containing protein, partial [Erythrobacter sp.]|nr:TPM domain-containing protein [Erythrobacter sp.]